jgi:hypothetical protein
LVYGLIFVTRETVDFFLDLSVVLLADIKGPSRCHNASSPPALGQNLASNEAGTSARDSKCHGGESIASGASELIDIGRSPSVQNQNRWTRPRDKGSYSCLSQLHKKSE